MRTRTFTALALVVLLGAAPAQAGLYYSGEQIADLPSQWRGFLLDQRTLRTTAVKPGPGVPPSPLRVRYQEEAAKLEASSRARPLTADEAADLGALHVRLGEVSRAVEVLRQAQRQHPSHFRIVANLGTAWQLQGDLAQAAACLQEAVRLAPGKLQRAEECHLRLVRQRLRAPQNDQALDDLFGVRYTGENGAYEPGVLAAAERKKLPSDAVALVQHLALWLPADGRLLWQLAELAAVTGDVRTAAAILDGCVTEFGLSAPELRQHRQLLRAAADAVSRGSKAGHEEHAAAFRPRSKRPLVSRLDAVELPPVSTTGVNALPWSVLAETTLDREFRPTFAKYLHELQGKQVALTGFMQPFGDETELTSFMLLEYPVGCWYCEMPEVSSIVQVDLPRRSVVGYTRGLVKVTGTLVLNSTDPESFLYTLRDAKVTGTD